LPSIGATWAGDPETGIGSYSLEDFDRAVRQGIAKGGHMPQFRQQYSDQEIADVVTFIRNGWGNQAPAVTAAEGAKLRKTTDPTSDQVIILKMR
jgi:mono/diheme cytochrome c family protein